MSIPPAPALSTEPHSSLLRLLQLASPTLPVGAYTYSEGLETQVDVGTMQDATALHHWLEQELRHGAIRLDAAAMVTAMRAMATADWEALHQRNAQLSALRETSELREQSWQMGRSLLRLLQELEPALTSPLAACGENCNFAIAYGVAAQHWQIHEQAAVLGYLQSWVSNLVTAGVKLIPLGQTAGQKMLLALSSELEATAAAALSQPLETLYTCSWGMAIASMNHETLYTRLFRS